MSVLTVQGGFIMPANQSGPLFNAGSGWWRGNGGLRTASAGKLGGKVEV